MCIIPYWVCVFPLTFDWNSREIIIRSLRSSSSQAFSRNPRVSLPPTWSWPPYKLLSWLEELQNVISVYMTSLASAGWVPNSICIYFSTHLIGNPSITRLQQIREKRNSETLENTSLPRLEFEEKLLFGC